MREFKFRAWNEKIKWMSKPFTFGQVLNFHDQIIKTLSNDEVVMQFTGLKDKNGVNIYERDILLFGGRSKALVTFENGCFSVFGEPLGWDFDSEEKPCLSNFNYCEVIGNIHENHELL